MSDHSTFLGNALSFWERWGIVLMVAGGLLGFIALGATLASSFILWKVASIAQSDFILETTHLKIELENAKQETLSLQRSVAWRGINDEQEAIIAKALEGKKTVGHFVVINGNDPEQAQFFQRIAGLCIKLNANCVLHPLNPQSPNPFLFVPTGVISFAFDDADVTFLDAFRAAGLITSHMGTLPGSQLFPAGVRAGIVIAAKPDASETWPFSTLSPKPQ